MLAVSLPYAWALAAGGDTHVFGGFLLNPIDGNSYLAKMMQGWSGAVTFTLPYTAEPGEGVILFVFYLFLGHPGAPIYSLADAGVANAARGRAAVVESPQRDGRAAEWITAG